MRRRERICVLKMLCDIGACLLLACVRSSDSIARSNTSIAIFSRLGGPVSAVLQSLHAAGCRARLQSACTQLAKCTCVCTGLHLSKSFAQPGSITCTKATSASPTSTSQTCSKPQKAHQTSLPASDIGAVPWHGTAMSLPLEWTLVV